MRTLRIIVAALVSSLALSACSAFQNASRKYLEKQAYDFAGLKLHEKLIGCAAPSDASSWREAKPDPRAQVRTREADDAYELRVEPTTHAGDLACDYAFTTDEERSSVTDAAIAYALELNPAP